MKIVIRVKFFAIVITIMLLMALAMSVVSAGAPAKVKVNLSEQHKEKINHSEPYKEEVNQSEEHEIVINLSETITIPTSRSSWSIETVDSAGYGHGHTSLALDSNGYPHISYYCWSWGYLKYAKWAGSEWEIETMDSTRDADYYSSLALDSNDYPHISYYDRYNENLKYAKWTGSVWDIEIVDLTRYVGMYTSLALDTSDCPHISYFHDIHGELMYAKWTGSAWDIETVDSAGYVGEYTSIALDSNGYPHISYYDYINKSLKYAKWTGSTWEIETVDLDGYTGRYTSIALDTNDYPHISYYGNSALKYARWTGSLWSIETLDLDARKDITSIALDTNDYPHISYYCSSPTPYADLKYAKWTGSIWSLQVVDSLGDVGSGSSLALDTTDCPHISYYDRSYDALKYAYYLSDIVTLLNITQAQKDKITYTVNENVTVSCIIQNETGYNITADSVDAEILKPDSSIEWVTMAEGLVGHYNGTFTNTSLNGTYNVTIYANKTGYVNDTAELWFEVANITGGLFIDSNQDFGSGSLAVAVGDIDNDGDLDVIFGDGGNKVYRNSGDGIFSYDYTFGISGDSGAGDTKSLKLGDFDGDGDLDLIEGILGYNAHAHAPAEVIIYENGGEGNFTYVKHLIHMQPSSYWDVSQFIELGDIDNDTDLDIVICLTFSNSVEIYLNDGGDFVKSHVMSSPFPKGGALGDIDNDGDLDLVTSNSEGVGNKVFKNNGSGYFIDTGQSLGSSYTYSVALADIDNDGDLDLAAANINTQNKIYLNDGTGNFTFFYAFGTARGYSHPVVFGDIDCDNDIDMITGGDTIYIYLNNGRGQFIGSIQNLTGTGSLTGDVALEDIDDDGDLDLITAGWKNKLYINTGERTLLNITQAQTDKSTYAFTETVTISCTVQNETGHNITADSVNADILKPDRSIEWVTMTEGLVGHYNGTFTNTSLNGTYNVMIYANKTGYVNDTAELSFEVSTLPVHNLDTGENFSSIQAAIDDSDTLDGHTIRVDAGTYNENVDVNKRLTIRSENGADVTVVQAVTHGYVIEVTASFVTISGFTVTGATGACGGIWLHQVDHCNICDNKVLHNDAEGIGVSSSCNNTLSGNDCFYNSVGIVLSFSNSNTLSGNDCSDNHYGISIMSSNDNELESNTVNSNHREGIHMVDSNNNVITKATASNNNWAIRMDDTSICSNNLIYLNNFINNANNIFISSGSTNIWNSPLEITYTYDGTAYTNYLGNYWDDYEGTDADGDGIGDTSYTINSENDNYPLMVGFENYTLKPPTPSFTSHAPESPVNDYVGVKRTFSITINQTVDVSWQINGTEVQTNASVTEASYTNTSAVNGTWNVSAIVTNANGTDMQTWDWTVTSPCFIATAAYGTPLHGDINVLRDFRDDYLMPNPAGRAFVKIYYDVSPPLANAIRDNGGLRTAVREGIVKPVVYITRRFVE